MACGTVSTTALPTLASENDLPILGVVTPTCAAAVKATRNKRWDSSPRRPRCAPGHTSGRWARWTAPFRCTPRRARCSCRWWRTDASARRRGHRDGGTGIPDAAEGDGHRHADAGLHPLSPADGDHRGDHEPGGDADQRRGGGRPSCAASWRPGICWRRGRRARPRCTPATARRTSPRWRGNSSAAPSERTRGAGRHREVLSRGGERYRPGTERELFAGGQDELTFRGVGQIEKTEYGHRLRYTAQNALDGSGVASEIRLENARHRAVVITESQDGGYGLLLDPKAGDGDADRRRRRRGTLDAAGTDPRGGLASAPEKARDGSHYGIHCFWGRSPCPSCT